MMQTKKKSCNFRHYFIPLALCALIFELRAAVTCDSSKDVDLRPNFCEQRDQDTIGWCYAYAAADVLTYQLHKENGKKDCSKQVSAVYSATSYINATERKKDEFKKALKQLSDGDKVSEVIPEGGDDYSTLKLLYSKGYCLESEISSQDFKWPASYADKKLNLRNFFSSIFKDKLQDKPFCESTASQLQAIFPNQFINDIEDIYETESTENLLSALEKSACPRKHKPNLNKSVVRYDRSTDPKMWFRDDYNLSKKPVESTQELTPNIEKVIDTVLATNSPVGIAIPYNVLAQDSSPGSHALSIVGKKINCETGEYEYILRNSNGGYCDDFMNITPAISNKIRDEVSKVTDYSTAEEKFEKQHEVRQKIINASGYYKPYLRCDNEGYIIISSKALIPKIASFYFIK